MNDPEEREALRDTPRHRLKFYGPGDYATYYQVQQAVEVLDDWDADRADSLDDVIELYNAQQFVARGYLPASLTAEEQEARRARLPAVRRTVAQFFQQVTDDNVRESITEVDFQYQFDLLELLVRYKVHERCTAHNLLEALKSAHITYRELLSSQALVRAYDADIKAGLARSPQNAEIVLSKYLREPSRHPIHLPASWTPADSHALLKAYVGHETASPNMLKLLAEARSIGDSGINDKLRLEAKRKYDKFTKEFFEHNTGIKTGVEISVSQDQVDEAVVSINGLVVSYSYSHAWLSDNIDYPTILNNFVYLFDWANAHMQWLLPSFATQISVIERMMSGDSKDSYLTGAAFRMLDTSSLVQTVMYDAFLRAHDIELESVLAWFFETYVQDRFGVQGMRFRPTSPTSSYLEKCRHLFPEMESVLKQFRLYVEEGELDPELLAMSSSHMSFSSIPSLLEGKYAYVVPGQPIERVQHLVFSDQSPLTYLSEELKDRSFAMLIVLNEVAYDKFHEYQQREIDFLIAEGVLTSNGSAVKFNNLAQFVVLEKLWSVEAASYHHLTVEAQAAVDDLASRGWIERRSSLLTRAEASYVNYLLNKSEYSNGLDLRNSYLHGSQKDGGDGQPYRETYIYALRMLIALIIKVNDDLALHADLALRGELPGESG